MRKFFAIAVIALLTLTACFDDNKGQKVEQDFTRRAQEFYNTSQPPHEYSASQARANLIAAQDAMALGADSWTVQYVEGVGVTFVCPSVGFPIPFGTNITNPEQFYPRSSGGGYKLPMMEPYGLYPPPDVPATYANCVLPNGEIGIFYSEPMLTTFLFDVQQNTDGTFEIPFDSEATVQVTREEASVTGDANLETPAEDE